MKNEPASERTSRIPKTSSLAKKPIEQENQPNNSNVPSYMNPTSSSRAATKITNSILNRPIEKGITKPTLSRQSMLAQPTQSSRISATNTRHTMLPSTTRPTTRSTMTSIPTKPIPAKTVYSTRTISKTPLIPTTTTAKVIEPTPNPTEAELIKEKIEKMSLDMNTFFQSTANLSSMYNLEKLDATSPQQPTIQPTTQPIVQPIPQPVQVIQQPVQQVQIQQRVITRKVIKKVPKKKQSKAKVDTSKYEKQIKELKEQLLELQTQAATAEMNNQLETETLNTKLEFLKSQSESYVNFVKLETEKGFQLKMDITSKMNDNNQLEMRGRDEINQINEKIETTTNELTEELRQKTDAFTNEVNALQTEIEFFEAESEERSQRRIMLEKSIVSEIATTENTERRIRTSETLRKKLHNEIQELKGNIRVICRVRPFLGQEKPGSITYSYLKGNQELLIDHGKSKNEVTSKKPTGNKQDHFKFDRVFSPQASQAEVFEEISHLVQSSLDGYNCCIFAYGQTGSGKTFTMEGPAGSIDDEKYRGMISRTVSQIFTAREKLKQQGWIYELSASFLEIYNDSLNDLLNPKKQNLQITSTTQSGKSNVIDLTSVSVKSPDAVFTLLKKASENRRTSSTDMNERSSRSHSIFQLSLSGKNSITNETVEGLLNLIDLAGSEKLDQSGVTGQAQKEAIFINQSLQCLGKVIQSLTQGNDHIPYRDCKLTRVLSNSLGGNSKTLMFVNVSPAEAHIKESINSLHFATKANQCEVGVAKKTKTIGKF